MISVFRIQLLYIICSFNTGESLSINLTLVRHGQTDANSKSIVEGVSDSPLNKLGLCQAKRAGKRLKNGVFDYVYASDLKRASETASIIVEESLNLNQTDDNIIKCSILRERDMGSMEGATYSDFIEAAKNACFNMTNKWDYNPDGGESTNDVNARAKGFIDKIYKDVQEIRKKNFNVLVVSHGILLGEMIKYLYKEIKCDGIQDEDMQNNRLVYYMPNTAIFSFVIEVDQNNGNWKSCTCNLYKSSTHLSQNLNICP